MEEDILDNQRAEKIIEMVNAIKENVDQKVSKELELDKCVRIIKRLDSFATSSNCKKCEHHLTELEDYFLRLKDTLTILTKDVLKEHRKLINNIISHLEKEHKLISEGYYLGIYMSIGISLGFVFGLVTFDNIALGLPIGMCIGIGIGAGLDADAKKKGRII